MRRNVRVSKDPGDTKDPKDERRQARRPPAYESSGNGVAPGGGVPLPARM